MPNEIQIVVTSEAHMDALRAAANDVNRLTQDEKDALAQRVAARNAAMAAINKSEQGITEAAVQGAQARAAAAKAETENWREETRKRVAATQEESEGTEFLNKAIVRLGSAYAILYIARRAIRFAEDALDMVVLGGQAEITAQVFEKLAHRWGEDGPSSLARLRASVMGTTSDLMLMQKMGAAVEAGLTFDQAKIAIEYLRNYSLAFGKDFETLMNSTMLSLESGTTRGLRQAGIIIDIHSKMFDGLDELQKKEMLVALAEEKMIQGRKDLEVPTDNAAVASERLAASWVNLKVAIGELDEGRAAKFFNMLAGDLSAIKFILDGGLIEKFKLAWANVGATNNFVSTPQITSAQAHEQAMLGGVTPNATVAALRIAGDAKVAADELKIRHDTLEQIGLLEAKASDDRVTLQTAEANKERDLLLGKVAAWKDADDQMKASAVARINSATDAEIAGFQHAAALKAQKEQDALDRAFDAKLAAQRKADDALLQAQIRAQELAQAEAKKAADRRAETYQSLYDQIAVIAGRASTTDPMKALEAEQVRYLDSLMKKATEAQIPIGQLLDLMNQLISAQDEQRRKAVEEQTIYHIKLFFEADASKVKTASDLAAYSVGLFVGELGTLDPAFKSVASGIEQIVAGAKMKGEDGSISPGGWASIAGGGMALLNTGIQLFSGTSETARKEFAQLQVALQDAADAGGNFARSITGSISSQEAQYQAAVKALQDMFSADTFMRKQFADYFSVQGDFGKASITGDLGNVGSGISIGAADQAKIKTAVEDINRISEAIARFGGTTSNWDMAFSEFSHLVSLNNMQDPAAKLKLLNEELAKLGGLDKVLSTMDVTGQYSLTELIASLQRDVTSVDIKARQDAAQTTIDAINQQASEVQKALDDSLSAQKAAVLRAVGLTFDVQEMALRASFGSRIQGASTDPAEMSRIVAQIGREIEVFRSAEASAGTSELARLNAQFAVAQAANAQATTDQLAAVQRAVVDTTVAFDVSLHREIGGLSTSLNADVLAAKATTAEIVTGLRADEIISTLDGLRVVSVNQSAIDVANGGAIATKLDAINATLGRMRTEVFEPGLGGINAKLLDANALDTGIINQIASSVSVWGRYETDSIVNMLSRIRTESLDPGFSGIQTRLTSGGSGGGGGAISLTVNITVSGPDANDANFYRNVIEPQILQSLNDGPLARFFFVGSGQTPIGDTTHVGR